MDSDDSSLESDNGRRPPSAEVDSGGEGGGGEGGGSGRRNNDRDEEDEDDETQPRAANSDVSDEENFSRGAKSIFSPPESPPGGANLVSPPASPTEGEEPVSPEQSAYSGSGGSRSGSSSPNRAPPDSPDSAIYRHAPRTPPESPRSPRSPQDSPDASSQSGGQLAEEEDDGRSNISSTSSFGASVRSPSPTTAPSRRQHEESGDKVNDVVGPSSPGGDDDDDSPPSPDPSQPEKVVIKSHGEDLSDVSDIDSLGSPPPSRSEDDKPVDMDINGIEDDESKKDKLLSNLNNLDEMEQLDFEAEEKEEVKVTVNEDDEPKDKVEAKDDASATTPGSGDRKDKKKDDSDVEEIKDDGEEEEGEKELEDGEISDEGENRPEETEPRPVCRFFSRGQCTWGSSCSFRHEIPQEVSADNVEATLSKSSPSPVKPSDEPLTSPSDSPLPSPTPQPLIPQTPRLNTAVPPYSFPIIRGHPRFIRPWYRGRGMGLRVFGPRFVHPGVTDKGNYTMFDMVRPLVPMNNGPPGPPPHLFGGPADIYGPRPLDRPLLGPAFQQPVLRRDEPPGESAWERGLRQAKEMLRRSTKRKETDVDFEEKKMNLTLSGQDEFDKENDYYTRNASPVPFDEFSADRYMPKEVVVPPPEKRYRSVSDRFTDYPPAPFHHPPPRDPWYDDRAPPPPSRYHYSREARHHAGGYPPMRERGGERLPPEEYFEGSSRGRKKYASREVTVARSEKFRDGSHSPRPRGSDRSGGPGRGDEWSDPWMRSKSPGRKGGIPVRGGPRKKASYSPRSRSRSRSSYSSSSSSRSSSYSSYSRSRSSVSRTPTPSRSPRSRSNLSRKRGASPPPPPSSSSSVKRAVKSPFSRERRGPEEERSLHMNPPAPSPRAASPPPRKNPSPPQERTNSSRAYSARLLANAMRDRSGSSRSTSGSESSGSSSDSSSDSGSSSSSSREPSPAPKPVPRAITNRKKIEIDDKVAQSMKVKAMDAMKLSGQKQQIKLTLKGGTSERLQPMAPSVRKRLADSPDEDDEPPAAKKKAPPSRREELLKQLKAVEDAIARKRSKI